MKKIIKWKLDDILTEKNFNKVYQEVEASLETIDEWINHLDPEMKKTDFIRIMEGMEKIREKISRLSYYAYLKLATNQKDAMARLKESKIDDLVLKITQKSRTISHWLKGKPIINKKTLDKANATRLFESIPDLEYDLTRARELVKHTLEQDKEEIISNKDINGIVTLVNLRNLLETENEYEVLGKKYKTTAEVTALFQSEKDEERKASYKALLEKQKSNIDKNFLIYQSIVKDWGYETRLRGYESPISMRNTGNDIPDKAIETLIETCKINKDIFQRYFKTKAEIMGKEKIDRTDVYAPILPNNKKTDYSEAVKLVIETFEEFGEEFAKKAKKIIDDKHIDVYPKINKESGAFCATVSPIISPFIMLNFMGRSRDVYTLAHELGHGVHSLYAENHFPSVQHANLPLAETASTMAEMIVFEKIYSQEKNKKNKAAMMNDKLADSYATILRQNYIVIFEQKAHEAIKKGITGEDLSKIWRDTLVEQFGDSVSLDHLFAYEWSYISHIFNSPFYCYAYNFGELLSLSLYKRYKEDNRFIKKIEEILAFGGSKSPTKILKNIGVDIEDKNFWQGSFDIIEDWQKELENNK